MAKIVKSTAHSYFLHRDTPASIGKIEMEQICSMCEMSIPQGRMVLRHIETKNILCATCLVGIAEIV